MTRALAAPSPLRDGEVALLPVDGDVTALIVAASHDPEITRWTQVPRDLTLLDASLLLIPITGFLPPEDPRVLGTVEAIRRELTVEGFVMRYRTREYIDGLPPGEGVFLACSFWLADNLALQGRFEEARELFEKLLALRNDVGLLAEEYDPAAKRLLGNYPQAFSHVALINTAMNLGGKTKPVEQRAEQKAA